MTPPELLLFYAEPDEDRWLPFDRYPRRLIRRLVRGPHRPGGQMRVFLNLRAGLERIGQPFRVNDFRRARRQDGELCCILGKRGMLDHHAWPNPLLVGPCIYNHPIDDPDLLRRRRVRRLLVPGEWMRRMCEPYWGGAVHAWPAGIDTERWAPAAESRDLDVLVYDKIRWNRPTMVPALLDPIIAELDRRKLRHAVVRYGGYDPDAYRRLLRRARRMVFLCEHETQGLACEEALASGVPVLAWDHGGAWWDPEYYPDRVVYAPVSSVPYWDDRCGERFATAAAFPATLDRFEATLAAGRYDPRAFVLEHLSLEASARQFVAHAAAARNSL
jgi:glycosyltransferase involved in cell wall biosynthesis